MYNLYSVPVVRSFLMHDVCICLFPVFRELLTMTCRVAGVLKSHGVKKGHEVIIYLPPCPLAVASMLACARIGAVHM